MGRGFCRVIWKSLQENPRSERGFLDSQIQSSYQLGKSRPREKEQSQGFMGSGCQRQAQNPGLDS